MDGVAEEPADGEEIVGGLVLVEHLVQVLHTEFLSPILRLPSSPSAVCKLAAGAHVGRDGRGVERSNDVEHERVERLGGVETRLVVGALKDGAVDVVSMIEHPYQAFEERPKEEGGVVVISGGAVIDKGAAPSPPAGKLRADGDPGREVVIEVQATFRWRLEMGRPCADRALQPQARRPRSSG